MDAMSEENLVALREQVYKDPRPPEHFARFHERSRTRDPDWVYAVVQNPEGRHLIRARRVVSAIPPKLENLKGFDLDKTEWSLFDQFSNTNFYTALAKIEGLPLGTTIHSF